MKKSITALDLYYLQREWKELLSSKVDKIYQPRKKELLLQLYLSGKGKKILRCVVPSYMYLTDHKEDQPAHPGGFCLFLRRRLENSRLREINQFGFERIIELVFDAHDQKYRLIFELFSKGNIVLCDEDYKIISPLETQRWSERTVKSNQEYKYPQKETDFLNMKKSDLQILIEKSKKNLVKTLAVQLGLGGTYAEELCLRAKVDKKKKKLTGDELKRLWQASVEIKSKDIDPRVVYENNKPKAITPFELLFFKGFEQKKCKRFNLALDSVLTKRLQKKVKKKLMSKHEKKKEKLMNIFEQQKGHIQKLDDEAKDSMQKAELIYKNYQKIDNLLKTVKEELKNHSWKYILDKHSEIVSMNPKNKTIVLDLEKIE